MDRYALRHLMAAIIVCDELKVPNQRLGELIVADEKLRKQFSAIVENTYTIVDLMLELGDQPQY